MTEQSSSLLALEPAPAGVRDVLRYAARPRVPESIAGFSPASLNKVGKLYLLDMAMMGVILFALLIVEIAGLEIPTSELEGIEIGPAWIAIIVLGAPLAEELAFRGWLSGRLGALIGSPIAALGCFLVMGTVLEPQYSAMAIAGGVLVAIGAAIAYWLHDKGPYDWF